MNQLKLAVSGAQILFVAFGAMVLVPLLTGVAGKTNAIEQE